MNSEKLISNNDIDLWVKSQNLTHNCLFFDSKIESIDQLFPDKNDFAIILTNDSEEVGHWVTLIKLDEQNLEYFDSFGKKPSDNLEYLIKTSGYNCQYSAEQLQNKRSVICGKYVIARIMSRDQPIQKFYEVLMLNKKLKPDEIIETLYRFPY